jgi:predicted GNAT family N-acyltransferase
MAEIARVTVKIIPWEAESETLAAIRREVFVDEQGVPEALEWDAQDQTAIHFLACLQNGRPVATARLQLDGKVGRMAVLKPWRRRGVGSAMLEHVIREAAQRNIRLYLHAQQSAIGFYRRFGFDVVGEPFDEAGIAHVCMQL